MVVKHALKPVAVGLLLISLGGAIALPQTAALAMHPSSNTHEAPAQTEPQFSTIEQPLVVKLGVTLAGLGLIGLELWWFLLSNKRSTPSKPS